MTVTIVPGAERTGTLFSELKAAHAANDSAVLSAYGFPSGADEASVVAEWMRRYQLASA